MQSVGKPQRSYTRGPSQLAEANEVHKINLVTTGIEVQLGRLSTGNLLTSGCATLSRRGLSPRLVFTQAPSARPFRNIHPLHEHLRPTKRGTYANILRG